MLIVNACAMSLEVWPSAMSFNTLVLASGQHGLGHGLAAAFAPQASGRLGRPTPKMWASTHCPSGARELVDGTQLVCRTAWSQHRPA
jgi:hypothetical protein